MRSSASPAVTVRSAARFPGIEARDRPLRRWKRNGWRTKDRKPVKNTDLWQRLDAVLGAHRVQWHWVKGHAGHAMNERADQLARDGLVAARAGAIGAMSKR